MGFQKMVLAFGRLLIVLSCTFLGFSDFLDSRVFVGDCFLLFFRALPKGFLRITCIFPRLFKQIQEQDTHPNSQQ